MKKRGTKTKELKITQEIADKVINLDCRSSESIRRLEKSLMRLPFIKSEHDLDTDRLEELIKKIERKYMIHLSYIMRNVVHGEDIYSGMLKLEGGRDNGRWIKTVYGLTMREVLAKSLFYMYFYIESNKKKSLPK